MATILGSHADGIMRHPLRSVEHTVWSLLTDLRRLALDLPEPTRICIFPICITGDMPQQHMYAGFQS